MDGHIRRSVTRPLQHLKTITTGRHLTSLINGNYLVLKTLLNLNINGTVNLSRTQIHRRHIIVGHIRKKRKQTIDIIMKHTLRRHPIGTRRLPTHLTLRMMSRHTLSNYHRQRNGYRTGHATGTHTRNCARRTRNQVSLGNTLRRRQTRRIISRILHGRNGHRHPRHRNEPNRRHHRHNHRHKRHKPRGQRGIRRPRSSTRGTNVKVTTRHGTHRHRRTIRRTHSRSTSRMTTRQTTRGNRRRHGIVIIAQPYSSTRLSRSHQVILNGPMNRSGTGRRRRRIINRHRSIKRRHHKRPTHRLTHGHDARI